MSEEKDKREKENRKLREQLETIRKQMEAVS